MNCMKCGREIEEPQVFCELCLEDMKKHPVKPGIAIQLPHKKELPVKKAAPKRRQAPTAEERVQKLQRRVRWLAALWLITLALLAATIYPTVEYFLGNSFLLPGQNYSTIADISATQP